MRLAILLIITACSRTPQAPLAITAAPQTSATDGEFAYLPHDASLSAKQALAQDVQTRGLRLDRDGSLRSLKLRNLLLPDAAPEAFAKQALQRFAGPLGIAEQATDRFTLEHITHDLQGKTHARFRQTYAGYPVDDRTIDVHFRDAKLSGINGSPAADSRFDAVPQLMTGAQAIARARLPEDQAYAISEQLTFVPVGDRYRLAFAVVFTAPGVDTRILVDAENGRVLAQEDRVPHAHARGYVYPINNVRGGREWRPLAHLTVGTTVTDKDGAYASTANVEFALKGPFVDVINDDRERYSYSGPADANVEFDLLDGRAAEVNAFVHVNKAHDWFAEQFAFTRLDHPIETHVRYGDCVFNAYAQGTQLLKFGAGCGAYDYAQSVDYVYHEYGHLVTNALNYLDYDPHNEAGAFSEGQSDYWACTMTNDARWGESPLPYLFERWCDNDRTYGKDYGGEAHEGGQLYSGSVWDLRKQFGARVADTLALNMVAYLPKRPTFLDMRDALIEADYDLYDSAHEAAIVAAFSRHGINEAPIVFITDDLTGPQKAPVDTTLTAHAQGFDRATVTFEWSFDDGATAQGNIVRHTFTDLPAQITLKVSDALGMSMRATTRISGCNAAAPGFAAWLLLLVLGLRRKLAWQHAFALFERSVEVLQRRKPHL